MLSQIEFAAASTTSTSCSPNCIVCARLARYAGKWSQARDADECLRANITPSSHTPRKPTHRSEGFPNPYITSPREFVSIVLQLKECSNCQREEDSDSCHGRQDDADQGLVAAANENTSESEADYGPFEDNGAESDDEDDPNMVIDSTDVVPKSQQHTPTSTLQLPVSEPKYDVGDTVFITFSNSAGTSQSKYGPLTITKRIHGSVFQHALEQDAEYGNCWYYHLTWDVMDGISWRPDRYFWHEDRLSK